MNKPMTTEEVRSKYNCMDIPENTVDVLDRTCSYTCPHCKERIWFTSFVGNRGNPETALCPYCNEETINPYPELSSDKS